MQIKCNYKTDLETKSLYLKPWQRVFARDMFKNWATDAEVCKFLTWEPHKNILETETIVSMWVERPNYAWAIIDKETNEAIGSIDIVFNREKDLCCEIGYCLSRKFWNRGYMTEALKKVIDFLFEEGYQKIELRHAVENPASGRVMQKAGMTFLCIKPRDSYVRGKFFDTACYYILNPSLK